MWVILFVWVEKESLIPRSGTARPSRVPPVNSPYVIYRKNSSTNMCTFLKSTNIRTFSKTYSFAIITQIIIMFPSSSLPATIAL